MCFKFPQLAGSHLPRTARDSRRAPAAQLCDGAVPKSEHARSGPVQAERDQSRRRAHLRQHRNVLRRHSQLVRTHQGLVGHRQQQTVEWVSSQTRGSNHYEKLFCVYQICALTSAQVIQPEPLLLPHQKMSQMMCLMIPDRVREGPMAKRTSLHAGMRTLVRGVNVSPISFGLFLDSNQVE